MPYNPDIHHRRSIRLRDYDYAQAGMYFVTLCTAQKQCLFGEVTGDGVDLNEFGQIVDNAWLWLAEQYYYVELGDYVVMPNHLHGIIVLHNSQAPPKGGSRTAPTETAVKFKPLGRLIGAFKTVSTKQINQLRNSPSEFVWQRNFYEHIVRNESSANAIQQYIQLNPSRWAEDEENPSRFSR